MDIDPSWVHRLMFTSKQLSIPAHLSGVLHGYDQLRHTIANMFTRFTAETLPRVRAWVNGGQQLAEKTTLSLPERLVEATGSPHYCVTFNGLSAWDAIFSRQMQTSMLDPLFAELNGAPVCGVDFYTFIGNYGYTPFGVHDDTDHSLLWHLGPASKVAYVWPRERYVELTGGTLATEDYEALLVHAQRYELHPGDLLFIPTGDFHILETREFSCTMGLTSFPDDMLLECTEGLRLMGPNEKMLKPMVQTPLTLDELANLRRTALRSNGSLSIPPNLNTVNGITPDTATLQRSTLGILRSYPLCTAKIAGRQALYVRGRIIWGRPNQLFGLLCEMLSSGDAVPFELLEKQLSGKVQVEAIAELVRKVSVLGGVLIEPR